MEKAFRSSSTVCSVLALNMAEHPIWLPIANLFKIKLKTPKLELTTVLLILMVLI